VNEELSAWEERSSVAANMLNPALIASVIAVAAYRFEKESGEAMPWELSFLIVPMALHSETRNVSPNRITSNLPHWVEQYPIIQAGLSRRAHGLAPYVREGLRWGLGSASLALDEGHLRANVPGTLPKSNTAELRAILMTAGFLGRWFSKVASPATVFAVLGVTP
jgi:hypothetical protein